MSTTSTAQLGALKSRCPLRNAGRCSAALLDGDPGVLACAAVLKPQFKQLRLVDGARRWHVRYPFLAANTPRLPAVVFGAEVRSYVAPRLCFTVLGLRIALVE